MEQSLGRVTTSDQTALAYATAGTGRTILYVSGWVSHLELSWRMREERAFLEALAAGCRLLRYDRAGCGLSDPLVGPPSLARELEQLDAVAAIAGPHPFDLVGTSMGAPVAVAWAAAHPDRVRRLVLYGGWADGSAIATPEVRASILDLIESHWGLGSDVLTDIFAPDSWPETRSGLARYQRASSSAATARALLALSYDLDVRALLPTVTVPTLVVHREGDRAAPVEGARMLAAGIPGARLALLPGRSHLPYVGDVGALVTAIRRFLGLRAPRRGPGDLTARQEEVAALVSAGRSNREIATLLHIEERSAEGHVERIRVRLGFQSRAQIASWYATRQRTR